MDEENEIAITPEEAESIIEWSLRAGALFVMMDYSLSMNDEELSEIVTSFSEPIRHLYNVMPDVMKSECIKIAQKAHDEAMEDEALVQSFMESLDELPETDEPE